MAQAAAQRDQLTAGVTEAQVAAARIQLATARAEERAALHTYDQLRDRKVEDREEQVAAMRLRAAEQARVAAEARLALAEKEGQVQVREVRATVWEAAALRDVAQTQLDLLQAGPAAQEIAAAEARVAQAEAALAAAQAALEQATLRAPFTGTVVALETSPGEAVTPGQVVLTLADLRHLRAETTDLSERDVGEVAVGQPAVVTVEVVGAQVEGQVVDIAPQATTIGGDVVYAVLIELDEQPPGLRWGMSVKVEIDTE